MIETESLLLKKAQFEDWRDMYANLWSREESAKYMLWRTTRSEEDAKSRMERTIAFQKEHPYVWTVYEKKSGAAIGFAGMEETAPGVFEESGIAVGPDFTGRGYGRQIVQALLAQAQALGACSFGYSCREKNDAAKGLARSCGFRYVRSEKKTDDRTGEEYNLEYYGYLYE